MGLDMRYLKEYMLNSSIHGLKYMCQDGRHWSERLFWLFCCSVSIWGTTSIVQATWNSFQTDAVSFVVDTTYPDWNTTFPALTVCQQETYGETEDYLTRRNITDEDESEQLMIMYPEIVFFNGICNKCSEDEPGVPWPRAEEFMNLTTDFLKTCEDLFLKCSWNGHPFDCCAKFLPVRTEIGYCFAVNSLQTIKPLSTANLLIANRQTGPGSIEFGVTSQVKVYQHAPQDVPTPSSISDAESWFTVQEGELMERLFSVQETYNEREVRDLSETQRNCLFMDENVSTSKYRYYSFSTCQVDCRSSLINRLCNCSVHHLPTTNNVPVCGHKGLSCISENFALIKAMRRSEDEAKNSFDCGCLPSCIDPEIKMVWQPSKSQQNEEEYSLIKVTMSALPTERLLRIVVRGKLDLVVAAGGTVGLFLGASILSTIEVIYYLVIRPISNKMGQDTTLPR